MNTMQLLKITALGAGFMHTGVLLADEAAARDQLNLRPYIRISEDQTGGEFRDQVKARIRTMSREERALMSDTGYNGRDRVTGEGAEKGITARERTRENAREEHYYGRGFESRQNQQQGASALSAPPFGGQGMGAQPGGFGGSGRGRGR